MLSSFSTDKNILKNGFEPVFTSLSTGRYRIPSTGLQPYTPHELGPGGWFNKDNGQM